MGKYSVLDCYIIELDKHHSDRKGNLTVVENGKTLPFDVEAERQGMLQGKIMLVGFGVGLSYGATIIDIQ